MGGGGKPPSHGSGIDCRCNIQGQPPCWARESKQPSSTSPPSYKMSPVEGGPVCSPRHTHTPSSGSYMGFQHTVFLAGEDNTDGLPRKEVAIFVSCSPPFRYQQTHGRGAECKTASQRLGIGPDPSAAIHQLRPAKNVSFTLPIWSCSHVTSTTPPSVTSGHLLK